MNDATLRQALKLRELRLQQRRFYKSLDNLMENFRDPVIGQSSHATIAAIEPVVIGGRPEQVGDTGWLVIIQDQH